MDITTVKVIIILKINKQIIKIVIKKVVASIVNLDIRPAFSFLIFCNIRDIIFYPYLRVKKELKK